MMVSLILLVLFTWLGMNGLTASTMETRISDRLADNVKAFYTAEAGLERAKSYLRSTTDLDRVLRGRDNQKNSSTSTDPLNQDNGILAYFWDPSATSSRVSYAGGTYDVRITDNVNDENPSPNDPWDDNDRRVIINSTGQDTQGNTRTLSAEVWGVGKTFAFNAAVSVYNNQAEKRFGSSESLFVITGKDTTYPSTTPGNGAGPHVRGMVSPDGASYVRCDSASACNKIIGWDLTPPGSDITNDYLTTSLGDLTLSDLKSMRTALIAKADIQYTGSTTLSGGTLGTPSDPKVVHANDTLKLQGTISGAGILIVDGNLEIEGTFTWQGVILISMYTGGSGRFLTNSNNHTKIYGAIAISSTQLCNEVQPDGDARIYYSRAALALANQKNFRTLSWKEELY